MIVNKYVVIMMIVNMCVMSMLNVNKYVVNMLIVNDYVADMLIVNTSVVIMMIVNMYAKSMLTFRWSKIGKIWKLLFTFENALDLIAHLKDGKIPTDFSENTENIFPKFRK